MTAVSPLHAFSMGICSISSSCPTPSEISAANSDLTIKPMSASGAVQCALQMSHPKEDKVRSYMSHLYLARSLWPPSRVSASSLRLPLVSPFVWALPREPFPLAPRAGPRSRDDQWRPPAREGGASQCAHLQPKHELQLIRKKWDLRA